MTQIMFSTRYGLTVSEILKTALFFCLCFRITLLAFADIDLQNVWHKNLPPNIKYRDWSTNLVSIFDIL